MIIVNLFRLGLLICAAILNILSTGADYGNIALNLINSDFIFL